ncbi:MAG: phosphopantetheine-binding protein [Coxiellaceae bacterium]|nr:phosphopantetheine-binding protein [Coxiellaceae bacterium]
MTTKTYESIKRLLVERFSIDPAIIRPEANLQEDLHLDSMDAIDLLLALNDTFSVRIPEKSLEGIHTLAELVQAVEANKIRL